MANRRSENVGNIEIGTEFCNVECDLLFMKIDEEMCFCDFLFSGPHYG